MSAVEQLLTRQYVGGTTVTNCVRHMGMNITDRPRDCELCATDIRNTLSRAIRANEWLNQWKDDAISLLRAASVAAGSGEE